MSETIAPKDKPYTTKRVLRHAFTGKDNSTIDVGRLMWGIGAISFIVLSIIMVIKTGTFNPLEWGSGFAVINGGSAAGVKLKESAEPSA